MRVISKTARAIVLLLWSLILIVHPPDRCHAACENLRAVSLRALGQGLQSPQYTDADPEELLQFANLSLVLGYVVDYDNQDLVIVGEVDTSLSLLHLEDFVVALRSAWNRYGDVGYPLCSIDPDPGVVRQLQQLGEEILSIRTPQAIEERLPEWHEVCGKPQKVRIEGLPFHSHFAQTMVAADYAMKSIVDGSDSVAVPGFASLTDMTLDEVRKDIEKGGLISVPLSMMNRFWFYPGENLYDEEEGIVMIHKCPVELLTEEMYVSKQAFVPGGTRNPLAKEFAENFTSNYEKVCLERPVYAELANLFRLVALANIIKYNSADVEKVFDLAYFLNDFPVEPTTVSTQLPGRSNVKRFHDRTDFAGGYQEAYFWLPSCGGVGIPIPIQPESFSRKRRKDLSAFRRAILTSKPAGNPVYWDCVYSPDTYMAKFGEDALLNRINETNKKCYVVAIEYKPTGFRVSDGRRNPLYQGDDERDFLGAVVSSLGTKKNRTIYLYAKDFPDQHKVDALITTIQIAQKYKKTDFSFEALSGIYQLQDFFLGEAKLVKVGDVVKEKGTWFTTLEFVLRTGAKTLRVIIKVLGKNAEIVQKFIQRIEAHFSTPAPRSKSLSDIISDVYWEMRQTHNLDPDDIVTQLIKIKCAIIDLREKESVLCEEKLYQGGLLSQRIAC